MAKLFASFYLLLVLVVFTSVRTVVPGVNGRECRLSSNTGGCPNEELCRQTCSGCYRGVGTITSHCEITGVGGLKYTLCFCVMKNGATCNPGPGESGRKCPDWPPSIPSSLTGNNTIV